MSEHHHGHRVIERHCDVAIVGGGPAGLAVARDLAAQRWSVIVVDATGADEHQGEREEARRHGAEVLAARATTVTTDTDDRIRIALTGGHAIVARRVIDATGDRDLDGDVSAVAAVTPNAAADWDHRYSGAQMWSGNPNGTLVHEVTALAPGRALDVGAGEGGDAIWLAEQGWEVTANDISQRALDRLAAEAERRGLAVRCHCADANAIDAFPAGAFDLVSAQYASIPRTADSRGASNLIGAVAPGGTLLVVSHDLAPMRAPIDTAVQSRPFDPDAYVRVDDVLALLDASPEWAIEVHEKRPRPGGSATAAIHVDDIVLRARRVG